MHVVCCLMHVICCMRCLVSPSSARWLLRATCCLVALLPCCLFSMVFSKFHVVGCMLPVACCTLPVACCILHVALHDVVVRCILLEVGACCLLRGACRLLFAAYCPLHAACCLEVVCCTLRVVRCIFPDACCMSSIVCCTFSSGRLRHAVRWIVSASRCLWSVARSPLHVVCCLLPFPAARPSARVSVACRDLSVACPISHLVTVHAADRTFPCRFLSLVRCVSQLARCLLHVVCCVLQSDTAPSHTQRIAAALAI